MKILQPIPVNTLPYPGFQTILDSPQLLAWDQATNQVDAFNKNVVLASTFLNTTFGNWLQNYDAGRLDPNSPPPVPPNGYTVHVADDGVTIDLVQDGPAVCSIPPFAKIPAPQTLAGAAQMLVVLGRGQSATPSPFNSSVSLGGQLHAADGSLWVRIQ